MPTARRDRPKIVSAKTIYRGKTATVRRVVVEMPSGKRGARALIEHPGSVAVVPVLDDGRLVLIRQFRLAVDDVIWEIPAGTLERGEDPVACAKRELQEETGYSAGKLERLFEAYLSPGSSSELMKFFMATRLQRGEQRTEEDELITVVPREPSEVVRMIASNEIRDAKTIAAIAFLRARGELGGSGKPVP